MERNSQKSYLLKRKVRNARYTVVYAGERWPGSSVLPKRPAAGKPAAWLDTFVTKDQIMKMKEQSKGKVCRSFTIACVASDAELDVLY